jgi:glycosyltransferase involved in cell wall biosynthesis
MNLIWLTPEFPSNKSNIKGIYIYRTVKELAKYYQIHVICLYPASPPILEMIKYWRDWKNIFNEWKKNYPKNSDAPKDFKDGQIVYLRYYRLPRNKFHHIEGWLAYFQARKYLSRIVNQNSIIHANWIFPAGTMASIISKKYKVPFLISLLGSDVNRLIKGTKFWEAAKKLLEQAHKVTAVTHDLFDKCNEKNIHIEKSKMELIDNIYDTDNFVIKDKNQTRKLLGISTDVKMIFYAGGLIPVKNVDVLIRALYNILNSRSDVNLFIGGEGAEEGNLKRLIEIKGISEKIFFLGPLQSDQMINYYNSSDLFCLPSKSEGLPNVIVESLLCGTPVVASAVGGIPTIVKKGVNGFLVEPNSVEDLADKINVGLDHPWDREGIRESISFLFPEKVIEKYHHVYKSLSVNFEEK